MALTVTLLFVSCGDDDDDTSGADTTATDTAVATTAPIETMVADTTVPGTTAAPETTVSSETTTPGGFLFTPPEGDYSILMPGEPTPNEQALTLPDGSTVPLLAYVYETADFAALVSKITYPAGTAVDLAAAVDAVVAGFAGSDLSSQEPISLQGRDGQEFVVNLDPGGADSSYLSRIFADGEIVYQTAYVGGDVAITDPEVAAFFDSFQFTEDG